MYTCNPIRCQFKQLEMQWKSALWHLSKVHNQTLLIVFTYEDAADGEIPQ